MLTTTFGKFIMTFLISMVPVVELRGGLPYGILAGLSLPMAATAAILGNMLPVPFIIVWTGSSVLWKSGPRASRRRWINTVPWA